MGGQNGLMENCNDDYQCSICFDESFEKDVKTTPCGHQFHDFCLTNWAFRNNSCPVCRQTIAGMDLAGRRLVDNILAERNPDNDVMISLSLYSARLEYLSAAYEMAEEAARKMIRNGSITDHDYTFFQFCRREIERAKDRGVSASDLSHDDLNRRYHLWKNGDTFDVSCSV